MTVFPVELGFGAGALVELGITVEDDVVGDAVTKTVTVSAAGVSVPAAGVSADTTATEGGMPTEGGGGGTGGGDRVIGYVSLSR